MKVTQYEYREILRGADYATLEIERAVIREDPLREKIEDAVARFLAGKLEGHVETIAVHHTNLKKMEIEEVVSATRKKGDKRRTYDRDRVALETRHVSRAHLHTRDRITRLEVDDDGERIAPWIGITLVNSDRIKIPLEEPKRRIPFSRPPTKTKATKKKTFRR